jgi:predicted regulator of Ras-like GTPase activity (Roadblock/LC7/MglB family)
MNVSRIQQILSDIKDRVRGLDGLLLITDDGFPIVSTLDTGEREVRSTAAGAILCDAGMRGITELDMGNLEAVVTLGSKGYFVLNRIKKGAILMSIASPDIALGMILLRIKKALPEIMKAIGDD